jgi:hypothetical protein
LHYDLIVPPLDPSKLKGTDAVWLGQRKRMTRAQLLGWDKAFESENAAFLREDPQGKERVRWAYQRYMKNYLRCVNGVDRSVGELLAWLDERPDVKKNTIVIYSSDQGFYLGDHGWYDKRWMYEESLRMPLVMSWPGHLDAGREVKQLTQNIDFGPTFLDLAGAPALAAAHGRSLVPVMSKKTGTEPFRDAIYYHYYESQAVHMVPAMYGVRTDRYKLVRYYEPQWDTWEMFDLEEDPNEMNNIAENKDYAAIRSKLEQRLVELRQQYNDDTGNVGGGEFPLTNGIARVEREGKAYRMWSNAPGGYMLKLCEPKANVTLTTSMLSIAGKQQQNGFIIVSGLQGRGAMMRCGFEFGRKRLVIMGPRWNKIVASDRFEWDGKSGIELTVNADFDKHEIVVVAAGRRITAPMPAAWTGMRQWGYGASNAETVFTAIKMQ